MSMPTAEFAPERYRGYLLVIARHRWNVYLQARFDPEDIVHDALACAINDRPDFRGTTSEEYRGWLCKILVRRILDKVKYLTTGGRDIGLEERINADVEQSSNVLCRFVFDGPSPSDEAAKEENLLRLADAMAQLSVNQFKAVSLHHLDGLTLAETAKQMGRTPPAVAGLLRRGLERLRELMHVGSEP